MHLHKTGRQSSADPGSTACAPEGGRASTAEVMADYVGLAGTGYVFAYPGDPIIEFLEACRRKDLGVVLARREGSAAFMAEAHGMLTGRPGTCLSTLGPGSSALVNGVAAATLDRVPMLAISGQIERSREQFFTHQVIDHRQLFSPVTKWAGTVEPASAPIVMRKAIRTAVAERPGAVHLSCASDVFTSSTANDVRLPPMVPAAGALSVQTSNGGPTDPGDLLRNTTHPVILAGVGAVRANATKSLIRLAEEAGIPVVVSGMAKGVFPEDHPYFAGVLDMACNGIIWNLLSESDLIVCAGFDAVELIKPWSVSTPVLHVDAVPNTDQIYFSNCELVGDVALGIDYLASDWRGEPRWSEADVATHRARLRSAYYQGRERGRLNPTDVVDAIREAMPAEAIATCDVGSHKLLVGQGWRTYEPRTTLMTNGLSSMGFGVPAAIAAQLLVGDRPVVAMVGDGGFAMTATELRLAANLGLGLVVVVLVDGSLNRIELKQSALGYPATATRLEDSDLVTLAAAIGCDGIRVRSVGELTGALETTSGRGRPLVIEARIDPAQYEAQF